MFAALLTSGTIIAQDYQVTFAIVGSADLPDSVLVENHDRNLEQVLQNGDVLQLVDATTGISNSTNTQQALKVYPNPMPEKATIEFYNATQGNVKVDAYTIDGKHILSSKQNLAQGNNSFVLSGLSKGIHVVHLSTLESKSTAVIVSNTNNALQPELEWLATEQSSSLFALQKSANSSQSIVTMAYADGEILNFTAYLGEKIATDSTAINSNTTISFDFPEDLAAAFPSDVFDHYSQWKITLGDGDEVKDLIDYKHDDFFYSTLEDTTNWVVYKTPNQGGTTANSSNTRSELRHNLPSWLANPDEDDVVEWTPEVGGKLTGTCKVMHVSATADATIPASFSVVVGQIHSSEGHENEPIKIYYKKFPGHTKGSVFWNYEINPVGDDNGGRWDYSLPIWGNDWSVVGTDVDTYPAEPADGIEIGEEFSYIINVYQGIMYLTFTSDGHSTKTFTKSLIESEYTTSDDIPQQVVDLFVDPLGQDGTERDTAYAGELQYFKQGAYNQTNAKDPADNSVWNTGATSYSGSVDAIRAEQYEDGNYTEVWFRESSVSAGTAP